MRNRTSPNKALGARLGDAVLSIVALAGAVSIILVVLGITLNVSIMMFRTGSMEPTIPTGSIAVVREIPATEMVEDDIITVNRGDDLLPVTHRVTEIQEVDEASGMVTFVMRGDANETDDPEPYTASVVQRTMFSMPGIAPAIQSLQNPLILGGLTLGATVLVIWAFWPRNEVAAPRPSGAHAAHGIGLPILLVLMAPTLMQHQVINDEENVTTEEITGQYLRLQSSGNQELMNNMVPGQPVTWAVDVSEDAPEPGEVVLELAAAGPLAAHPDAMTTEVVLCAPHPDALLQCHPDAGYDHQLIETSALVDTDGADLLGSMSSKETRRVLITSTLSEHAPAALQNTDAELSVIATGQHEQLAIGPGADNFDDTPVSATSPDELSETGVNNLWLVALALLLLMAGIAALLQRSPESFKKSQSGTYHA